MKIIELTANNDDGKIYVNADVIMYMYRYEYGDDNCTVIQLLGERNQFVKEKPEEILNKISYNETNMLYDIQCIVSDRLEEIFASIGH